MQHMTRAVATLSLLGLSLVPVGAQTPPKAGATGNAPTSNTRPVGAVTQPCTDGGGILDGAPRTRPVVQFRESSLANSNTAQVVAGVPSPPGYRQVAYGYSFGTYVLLTTPYRQGQFIIHSVRTTVFMGPTSAYPVASDTTVTGGGPVSLVNSVRQQLVSGPGAAAINDTWLVRNITTGVWSPQPLSGFYAAQVDVDCTLAVQPAATLVLQPAASLVKP